MIIWMAALLFLTCAGSVGYYQGAIRMAMSFLGLVLGAVLAVPLSGLVKPILPPFGLAHPVLVALVAPAIVFVLFQIIFKTGGMVIHRMVDTHYKYKESDTRRSLWERVNERLGIGVGFMNATVYLLLVGLVAQILGYFTIQVSSGDKDTSSVRMLNRVNEGLKQTGLSKAVAALNPMPALYYDAVDIIGDFFHQPLLQSRFGSYPPFLKLAEKPEFKALGDIQFQEFLQKEHSIGEFMAHDKVKPLLGNKELYQNILALVNNDLKDLIGYLETGKSEKFDAEKILGHWEFDAAGSLKQTRKDYPRLTSSDVTKLKGMIARRRELTFTAYLDKNVSGQLSISNRVEKFPGTWKNAGDNKYDLNLNTPVRKLAFTGVISENRMVANQDKFTGLFDKLP